MSAPVARNLTWPSGSKFPAPKVVVSPRQSPDDDLPWPPIGTQVILRRPHIWQGWTGVVAAAPPALPTGMVVRLHENGKDVQVSDRAEFRVLPPEERRA